jgi:hypothetical protein
MTTSPQGSLRDVVAQADRQRRARIADRLLSRIAPVVALGLLVLAIVGRFADWPRWVPLAVLAVSALVLGLFAVLQRRGMPTSDATASVVDADAGLRGELRSAHWFEAIAPDAERNAWAAYHIDVAADRAAKVDWPALYPAVKAGRQWAGTALLSAAVIAMSVALPQRVATAPADAAAIDPALAAQLPPDLAKKLAALMAQLQAGEADAKSKQMSLEEMKAMMAKLDPAMQKKLAEMLEKMSAAGPQDKAKANAADARPERAENSAAGLPEDVRWAQEDLAQRKAQGNEDRQTNGKNPSASSETGEKGMGSAQAEQQKAGATAESATPMVREAAADPGGKMMMGGGGPMGGDSRPGAGGNQGAQQGAAEALLLAQALKKDTLEAHADALGENVEKDDLKKKTEQGKSALGYTRVAESRTFDPSRAAAPPPVPEARRQLLLNYFIRKR